MDSVFVDTSALYALVDRDDGHHKEAISIAQGLREQGSQILTTNYIVAETHVLILSRIGHHVARRWLRDLSLLQYQVTEDDQAAAKALILTHTDKDYSLTDATSFSLMRRLGITRAFAFDDHFAQIGYEMLTA